MSTRFSSRAGLLITCIITNVELILNKILLLLEPTVEVHLDSLFFMSHALYIAAQHILPSHFYQKTWAAIPQWGDLGSSLDPGHRCALSCPGCIIWIWSLWLFQFISGLRMIEYANKKCKHFKHNITMKCVHIIWIFAHNMSFMDSRGSVLRLFIFLFHCCVYMC